MYWSCVNVDTSVSVHKEDREQDKKREWLVWKLKKGLFE